MLFADVETAADALIAAHSPNFRSRSEEAIAGDLVSGTGGPFRTRARTVELLQLDHVGDVGIVVGEVRAIDIGRKQRHVPVVA